MEHHQNTLARFGLPLIIFGLLFLSLPSSVWAQHRVSLEEAIEVALANGPSIAMARADSVIAAGRKRMARAFPNPDMSVDYSEDPPQDHFEVEQALEYPWVRSSRVRAAKAALQASHHELAAARAAVRYDVQTAYVRAAAAQSIFLLSERNADDAGELLRITKSREESGDASELDVHVAAVFAGQATNDAFSDSLETITSVLQLQALMGQSTQEVEITLADSLESLTPVAPEIEEPLRLAAARAQLLSEQANLQWSSRNRLPAPALRGGFETDDPEEGDQLLPTFGVTLAVPLWNRGGGNVDEARGMAAHAEAELQLVDRETHTALAIAQRERDVTRLKVERGREVVRDAQRVAELATSAYRDGAYSLPSVLEAQRNARDSLRQFILDLQASRVAEFAFERAQIIGGVSP
jgi:outer membrane protein TolC